MVTARLIGQVVTDGARSGILTDVIDDWEDPASAPQNRHPEPKAFVRPARGGTEWAADPAELSLVRPAPK